LAKCQNVAGRYLDKKDFPVIRSKYENDAHAVHPSALFAGEKGVVPSNVCNEQIACIG
jgi:hypothetical protein